MQSDCSGTQAATAATQSACHMSLRDRYNCARASTFQTEKRFSLYTGRQDPCTKGRTLCHTRCVVVGGGCGESLTWRMSIDSSRRLTKPTTKASPRKTKPVTKKRRSSTLTLELVHGTLRVFRVLVDEASAACTLLSTLLLILLLWLQKALPKSGAISTVPEFPSKPASRCADSAAQEQPAAHVCYPPRRTPTLHRAQRAVSCRNYR